MLDPTAATRSTCWQYYKIANLRNTNQNHKSVKDRMKVKEHSISSIMALVNDPVLVVLIWDVPKRSQRT